MLGGGVQTPDNARTQSGTAHVHYLVAFSTPATAGLQP
jgi:hypothetical protein